MKRIKELVVSDRFSTMLICIQRTEEGEVCGEIYSCYLKEPIWFSEVGDVVLKLSKMCNWIGISHTTANPCFLSMETERCYREVGSHHPQADRSNLTCTMDQIPFRQALKAGEALIVYVEHRQFFSLQGSIRERITKGKVINFRSALELTRVISIIQL